MNTALNKFPFYVKASLVLVGIYVLVSMLSILQTVLLPFIFSVFIAILLSPVIHFLVSKKINRILAITIVVMTSFIFITAIFLLLASQFGSFVDALPQLKSKFVELLDQAVLWFSNYTNIEVYRIRIWIDNMEVDMGNNGNAIIGSTLSSSLKFFAVLILVPVYVFMLLVYQKHLLNFIHRVFGYSNAEEVDIILSETKSIIRLYIVGLFIEIAIVAILNSVGLLLLGIKYAVLLGVCGALLNIIPYLGGLITMCLFTMVALVTEEPVYALYVIMLYSVIQFIDNNYLVPKIIGSKVKLNALVSLMAVIFGAMLWGVPGMFLFIPLVAIVKVIFDRVEPMKSFGYLLGYD